MSKYQTGKIYSVRSLSRPDLIYIGSTIQILSKRMAMHRSILNCSSKIIVDIGDSYIELEKNFPCNDKYELRSEENKYIRSMICVNKLVAIDDCSHGKTQSRCVDCNGKGLCEHKKIKSHCKDCDGSQICPHGRIKSYCVKCKGSSTCEHSRIRRDCKDCNGSGRCKHNLRKAGCKLCYPINCDICKDIFSKCSIAKHLNSIKHLKNLSKN